MKEYIDKAALLETFDKLIVSGIYSVAELNVMRNARRIVRNAPVCEFPNSPVCEFPKNEEEEE